jgi:malonyl-CoA O-methyltransferase
MLQWLRHVADAPLLVCIHGWGASADIWQATSDALPEYAIATLELPGFGQMPAREIAFNLLILQLTEAIKSIDALKPIEARRPLYLMGWSLGGQVAAALTQALPHVRGLITVASNPCFVAREDWPMAMPVEVFSAFCAQFNDDATGTFKRFCALQCTGSRQLKLLRKQVAESVAAPKPEQQSSWAQALAWLALDQRPALQAFAKPQLHLLAANDALVPANLPLQAFGEVQILEGCSHLLPLEAPIQLARAIDVFIKTHSTQGPNKTKVSKAFSHAAGDYEALAEVQKTVAKQLLMRLPPVAKQRILDIGTGTGALVNGLLAQGAEPIALDIAQGMLVEAKKRCGPVDVDFIAADAEYLPLADNSVDGVVSSLAVQWCSQLPLLFSELMRVLKPGGWAQIATLGPATLQELKTAWQQIDDRVHVNAFASCVQLEHALKSAGAKDIQITTTLERCHYPSLMPLLKSVKGIGAHNSHVYAPSGLMTPARFKLLADSYPRNNNDFVASYAVVSVSFRK